MPASTHGAGRHWPAALCLLPCTAGVAAAWALLALALTRQCGWMAIAVAADAVLVLRLLRAPPGAGRALLAVVATALGIALANWWIAGGQVGLSLGMPPWEAIPRLGFGYAWTLARLANTNVDLGWMLLALAAAAWFGGRRSMPRAVNGRRRAP